MESKTHTDAVDKCEFLLFVSGMSVHSAMALDNIRRIIRDHIPHASLTIVDIGIEKERAMEYQIIGIPTLIRIAPLPNKTIVGDLSDLEKVLKILEIVP